MKKTWYTNFLGGMSEVGYGTFSQEPQEIGLKTWLGGGKIVVNKKCWYAHLHKGQRYKRKYRLDEKIVIRAHDWAAWYWMNDQWKERKHNFEWFIRHFWPVQTWEQCWYDDWGKSLEIWNREFAKWVTIQ